MDYKVIIPQEHFIIVRFKQDNILGVASLNRSLVGFEPKQAFGWHLSVMLHLSESDSEGQPCENNVAQLNAFEDSLDHVIKGDDPKRPNGLFLARIAWNSTIEIVYRAYDPQHANKFLKRTLEKKSYPEPFDYRIDPDSDWSLAQWHLKTAASAIS